MTPDEKFQEELNKAILMEKILDQYNEHLDILAEKLENEDYKNMRLLYNKYWKNDEEWRKEMK